MLHEIADGCSGVGGEHNVINIVIRIRQEGILRTFAHLCKEMDKDRFNMMKVVLWNLPINHFR